MNSLELKRYFLEQIESGKVDFRVGIGKANYKMKRGSFKTKDNIKSMNYLKFDKKDGNKYYFTNGKTTAAIIVEDLEERVRLSFEIDSKFNRFYLSFYSFKDEYVYGCGEQYTTLDLKNKSIQIWVSEHHKISRILIKLLKLKLFGPKPDKISDYKNHQTYASFPLFISSKNYGFYVHDDNYANIKFRDNKIKFLFRDIPKSISLLTADNQIELTQKVTKLIGLSPRIPDWVNDGVILAIQGGTDVVKKKYNEAKEKGVKISAIWSQDWCGCHETAFGYQVYWNWEHDNKLYVGLKDFIDELKKDGVRYLGYINTFLKENSPMYLEAKEKGFLVQKNDGDIYQIQTTTFNAGIVDLTNLEAFNWYKDIIKNNIIEFGLDGFMADFGEYLPTDAVIKGGDAERLHNKWPTLWAKCCNQAIRESGRIDDVFIFSRAAFSHTVEYTNSIWNGDQHVDFSDEYGMGSIIPATLSLACSGTGVVHSDIGGYTTLFWMKRDSELFNRWSEMNIFTPIYRTHEGNRPKENAQFDNSECIKEFAKNTNIFYDLKSYRKFVENEYQLRYIPMIRPLFFHYEDDRSRIEKREFLFGEDILVSPVMRPNEINHKVYLPDDEWVQFFTLKEFKGGNYVVPSPLGLPIAFYKANSKFKDLFEEISKKYNKEID